MKRLTIFTLFLLTILNSCNYIAGKRIKGNGIIKTENRTAVNFKEVHVSGSINVYVKQDSISSIRVEADENLLQYILTENAGETLEIHSRRGTNLKPTQSIKVYVSGANINSFDASGACNFFSENKIISANPINIHLSGASDIKMELKAPKVDAELSGAGSINLSGETRDFRVDGSGSTNVKCFDLLTENTQVKLSGAGNAEVFASVQLDVKVSGAADVKYKGNAAVSQKVSGAGSVKKVE
jgi:hypothetical protein